MKLHNIQTLLLEHFFRIMFHQEYELLIIEGEPTQEELDEAWEKLHDRFMQRGGGINYKHSMAVIKDIARLSSKITIVECTIELMRLTKSVLLNDIINDYGFKCLFPFDNPDQYYADLKFVESKLQRDKFQLIVKEEELAAMATQGKGQTMDEEAYMDMIWDMTLAFKLQLNIKALTVNDFLLLMKKYKQHIDSITRNSRRNA